MQKREEAPDQDDVTDRLNAIYEREPSELDPVLRAAQARALSEEYRAEIERVRADDDFTARAKGLIERDQELLERLA